MRSLLASIVLAAWLCAPGSAGANWRVALPGLQGTYYGGGDDREVTIDLPESLANVTGMSIQWAGTMTWGEADYDGDIVPWPAQVSVFVRDPEASLAMAGSVPSAGAFSIEAAFFSPDGYSYLSDHQVTLGLYLINCLPEPDEPFTALRNPECTLDSVTLVISTTPTPTTRTTWGAVRRLYR